MTRTRSMASKSAIPLRMKLNDPSLRRGHLPLQRRMQRNPGLLHLDLFLVKICKTSGEWNKNSSLKLSRVDPSSPEELSIFVN
ncbi:hypothetical protein H5410_061552 [Solanum commersonii]|uniref:Uncharacterized protein n=1 Tax=Solanum commersonii TaxID=4109 RepID=A0A9J5W8C3_SOLCO|nr:hypothetical protein H5410_061552 [Solanum commersonii]